MGCLVKGNIYFIQTYIFGPFMLTSLHEVVDRELFEQVLKGNFLQDSLKLLVFPVNVALPISPKGAKTADTVGTFFGKKNVTYTRRRVAGIDCATLAIDVYSVFSLRMLLPALAFKEGRIVDYHLVSYRGNASLTSFRMESTEEFIQLMKDKSG